MSTEISSPMPGHLTQVEATAILAMSTSSQWASFKDYIIRRYSLAKQQCLTTKEDHRFYQGGALELSEIVMIEEKAKNTLGGG